MDSDLWRRAGDHFLTLVDVDVPERAQRLGAIRDENPELADAIEQLFAGHATTGPIDDVAGAAEAFGQIREEAMAKAQPLGAGDVVGDFKILDELGRGGMATVFRARRVTEDFEQEVALKVLSRGSLSEAAYARFDLERQIAAKLDHPEIAGLIDGGITEDGRPFFALELVDGVALTDYCDQHRLPVRDRVRLLIQVAGAVHYAHQNLLVHRDLKPSNILVDRQGRPRLLDFGIAKLLDPGLADPGVMDPDLAGAALTQTGTRLLTPLYSSPEQFRGQTITTGSDQYQLGLLLFELITGRRHHQLDGEDPRSIGRRITDAVTPRPSSLLRSTRETRSTKEASKSSVLELDEEALREILHDRQLDESDLKSLRGDLDTIVLKALEKDPTRRYPTVKAFMEDLERYLNDLPIEARPASAFYRFSKFAIRHRFAVAAGLLAILAILGGTIIASWQAIRASRAEEVALVEAATATRVSEFLVDLFNGADPGVNAGREVSAAEILKIGRRRLERELKDEPVVRGRLLRELSSIYNYLGDLQGSVELGEEALEAHRAAVSSESRVTPDVISQDIADDHFRLGEVQARLGELDEAEKNYRESHRLNIELHSEDSAQAAQGLAALGKILAYRSDFEGAEAMQRKALALRLEHLDPISAEVGHSHYFLAWVLSRNGRYEEAREAVSKAIDIDIQVFGEISRDHAEDLALAAEIHRNLGEDDEAIRLGQQQLAIAGEVYGPDHHVAIRGLEPLALGLIEMARYEEAEEAILRSLEAKKRLFGERAAVTADALHNLGYLQQDRGDFEDALSTYRQAIDINIERLGEESIDVAELHENLGEVQVELGLLDEAENSFQRALRDKKKILRPDHPRLSWSHWGLGLVAWQRGELALARGELEQARDLVQNGLGPDHPDLAYSLHILANVARDSGAFDEAEHLYKKVLELRSDMAPERPIYRRTVEDHAELARRRPAA